MGALRWPPGCGCCNPCAHPLTLQALGCPTSSGLQWPLPNAPITITDTQGTTIASGTTDSDGNFAFSSGIIGQTYVCAINALRFNRFVKDFTFACGALVPMNVCRDAGPQAGYACCVQFAYPVKTVLSYTDANGTRSLVFQQFNDAPPGGACIQGNWQVCYNAPAIVGTTNNDGSCTSAEGVTPVLVGWCSGASMTWANLLCDPVFGIGGSVIEWKGCVNAPAGVSFRPEVDCFLFAAETLSCANFGSFSSDCLAFGFLVAGSRGIQFPSVIPDVLLAPPAGLVVTGSWGAGVCPPVMGGFTISE